MTHIKLSIDASDQLALKRLLRDQEISFIDFPAKAMNLNDAQIFYSLIVPTTLVAVQIIASYLMHKQETKGSPTAIGDKYNIKININGIDVAPEKFSIEILENELDIKIRES